LIKELLLDFEPRKIQLEENYKEPLKEKDTANNFYCSDELFSIQKDLLPAIQKDVCEYLTKCNSEGKYTGIDYYKNLRVTTDNYSGANKNDSIWWLHSADEGNTNTFYYVNDDDNWNSYNAINGYGVSVAFRL
jgi:hypothetical protein